MAILRNTKIEGFLNVSREIKGRSIEGGVFNDYAEFRKSNELTPGRVVVETGQGDLILSTDRLLPGGNIISDTYGFSIGQSEECQCPIAVCGRVLAHPFEDIENFRPGDPVCTGPEGTVSLMTREEVREWPDRILGTVSEIPDYFSWGDNDIFINGRIWIKVK